jgi:hypothetical protein
MKPQGWNTSEAAIDHASVIGRIGLKASPRQRRLIAHSTPKASTGSSNAAPA